MSIERKSSLLELIKLREEISKGQKSVEDKSKKFHEEFSKWGSARNSKKKCL